ncbi:VanW family protein [Patescibacteria group bacterium]|nr:VanW family protein [Patescibacteria group bacterium]
MISTFTQSTNQPKNHLALWLILFSGVTLLSLGLIILILIINSLKGIFPDKTYIANIDVSLLNKNQALSKINEQFPTQPSFEIKVYNNNQEFSTTSGSLSFTYKTSESVDEVFAQSHSQLNILKPLNLVKFLLEKHDYSLQKNFDPQKISDFTAYISQKIDIIGHDPYAKLGTVNNLKTLAVDPGKIGSEIDQIELINLISQKLNEKNDSNNIELTSEPKPTYKVLSDEELIEAEKFSAKYINTTLYFNSPGYKDIKFEINPIELVSLLSFPTGINERKLNEKIEELAAEINRPSRDAIFNYEKLANGKYKVNDFQPHLDGLAINKEELKNKITNAVGEIASSSEGKAPETITNELVLETVQPTLTLEKLNDLGIKELIGYGDSYYAHSIPNRIWNVALTAQKINYSLIAPGEEFSFNKTLGEVSKRTGYRSAYVISGGKTVLGDGGGVCQVSTTVFRAALNAGLNITKRKAHSYRVSYYELNQKPGIDATVYSGDVDLRFINDTPGYILIKTESDSENLYMDVELYGTSDGRTAEILNHKTWDPRSAPPAAYYPTTEIPAGTTKQIDWAVSGIKASFDYVVKDKNGQVIREENFYSNYVPWSAKYLQGI